MFYKIIAKVLANKLKLTLLEIILPTQSAFILERLVSDNIKSTSIALKSNMSKAYDKIKRDFLRVVMHKMSFDGK